jgi:glycosyltransferase involved in cell wall biosynthesis
MAERLAYISPSFFLDTDLSILGELARYYRISWHLLWSAWERKYTIEHVVRFCDKHEIELTIFRYRARFRDPRNILLAAKIVLDIRRTHPRLIYFEGFSDPYLPFVSRALLPRDAVIVGMHDAAPHAGRNRHAYRFLNAASFSLFKNFHFFSQNQHRIFLQRHPRKASFVAGMYLKDFGESPARGKTDPERVTFLFFGWIRFNKGLEFLIGAGNRLAGTTGRFRILIAGESEDSRDYRALVEHPEVFDLRIGPVASDDIPGLFSEADFLVLPYRDVTQSGPLMIAYRYGVPVIASDLPGFRECVIPGETGFLFEPCNAAALEAVMEQVLALTDEDRRRLRSGVASYAARNISLEKIVGSYRSFFDAVGGQSHSSLNTAS